MYTHFFEFFSHQHKLEHRIVVVQCTRVTGWAMFRTTERLKNIGDCITPICQCDFFSFFAADTDLHQLHNMRNASELLRNGCTGTHSQKEKLRAIDFYTYLNQRGECMKRRRQLKYYLKTKPETLFENWVMCSEWLISRNRFYCLNDVVNSEYRIDFYFNKIFVSEVRTDGKWLCNNNRLSVNQKNPMVIFFFVKVHFFSSSYYWNLGKDNAWQQIPK